MNSMTAMLAMWLLGAGADWSATFPPAATGSYLGADANAVLVAAAGEPSPDLAEAAKALAASLRASGRAKLVMDSSAIGPTAGLSDEQIVEKCKALPVQLVVVVRVFPGADAARPSAVVTFYDKAGKAMTALAAEAGTPVAAREAQASGGVSGGTMNAVVGAVTGQPGEQTAQQKYDEQYIWFADVAGINASGQIVGSWTYVYEGKYRRLLSTEELLRKVGGEEMARTYVDRSGRKAWLGGGGLLLALGGGIAIPIALNGSCTTKSAVTRECVRNNYLPTLLWVAATGAGVAMVVWSVSIPPPVDPVEVRRLTEQYNEKLKKSLGLAAAERRGGPAVDVRISLGPGGLSLSGTF